MSRLRFSWRFLPVFSPYADSTCCAFHCAWHVCQSLRQCSNALVSDWQPRRKLCQGLLARWFSLSDFRIFSALFSFFTVVAIACSTSFEATYPLGHTLWCSSFPLLMCCYWGSNLSLAAISYRVKVCRSNDYFCQIAQLVSVPTKQRLWFSRGDRRCSCSSS